MTAKQSLSPILSDTTYKVANSSSSADTLFINSTPFLQSALCKDGVKIHNRGVTVVPSRDSLVIRLAV